MECDVVSNEVGVVSFRRHPIPYPLPLGYGKGVASTLTKGTPRVVAAFGQGGGWLVIHLLFYHCRNFQLFATLGGASSLVALLWVPWGGYP
jgi:hypothetical protein